LNVGFEGAEGFDISLYLNIEKVMFFLHYESVASCCFSKVSGLLFTLSTTLVPENLKFTALFSATLRVEAVLLFPLAKEECSHPL
jgi:hypothetical protein